MNVKNVHGILGFRSEFLTRRGGETSVPVIVVILRSIYTKVLLYLYDPVLGGFIGPTFLRISKSLSREVPYTRRHIILKFGGMY